MSREMLKTASDNISCKKQPFTKQPVDSQNGKRTTFKKNNTPEFSKFQTIFWPLHTYELKKFLPMCFLLFCILFVYSMVKNLKDVFVQTYAISGGAQLLSALKLFFVMPCAVLSVMIFTLLINKFGKQKTFYIIISFFSCFYAIFGFIIFPNVDKLHGSAENIAYLRSICPRFFYNIIPCITNWAYTLFYIISEMWGTMAISSLFWQFANQVTKKNEVKRFFGLFSTIGNMGVIVAGGSLKAMAHVKNEDLFDAHVKILMAGVIAFGILTMVIYAYINNVVMKDPFLKKEDIQKKTKPSKEKVGLMQGIKILFSSRYLLLIAVLIIGFGICSNFIEVLLKEKMRDLVPSKHTYSNMTSNLTIVTGVFSIIVNVLSANVLRRCKWKTAALVTPMILLIFGGLFFGLVLWGELISTQLFGFNVLTLAVTFGITVDALAKSVKFSLFDTTKSMAYIPLDDDTKTKGQAAVEVIGGRLGKAGSSTIQYMLMSVISLGSKLSSHLLIVVPTFIITAIGWIMSVFKLSNKYEKAIGQSESIE